VLGTGNASTNSSVGSYRRSLWFFDGDIADIIVYDKALTTTERQNVETFLKNKRGIS
jgi:hypothetical protein